MKLKKDDLVIVTKGKEKGKTGKIIKVLTAKNSVIIEGMNQFKKHVKARQQGQKSEIITIQKPISASNVAFIDPKTKKASRIGYKIEKGVKVRISKASGQTL